MAIDSDLRYSRVAILLHWTIAVLILINLATGLLHDAFKDVPLIPVHKSIGMTVLVLSIFRLLWRLAHPVPLPAADTPRWQRAAAGITHGALYALMIAMPLTGWWFVSAGARKYPLDWFGLFPIPFLPLARGGDVMHAAHEWLGWGMLALVLLHVVAALKHHLIDRDTVLARMAPAFARR